MDCSIFLVLLTILSFFGCKGFSLSSINLQELSKFRFQNTFGIPSREWCTNLQNREFSKLKNQLDQRTEAEKLTQQAEYYKIQAERMRMEAERQSLLLKMERNQETLLELKKNATREESLQTYQTATQQEETDNLASIKSAFQQDNLASIKTAFKNASTQTDVSASQPEASDEPTSAAAYIEPKLSKEYDELRTLIKKSEKEDRDKYLLFLEFVRAFSENNGLPIASNSTAAIDNFLQYLEGWNIPFKGQWLKLIIWIFREGEGEDTSTVLQAADADNKFEIQNWQDAQLFFNRSSGDLDSMQEEFYFKRVFPNEIDITSDEITTLKEAVFGKDVFYVNTVSKISTGVIFEGLPQLFTEDLDEGSKKRKVDYIKLSKTVQERLAKSSLANRCRLFLIRDPRESEVEDMDFDALLEEAVNGKKPIFVATTIEATEAAAPGTKTGGMAIAGLVGSILLTANFADQPLFVLAGIEQPPMAMAEDSIAMVTQQSLNVVGFVIALQAVQWAAKRFAAVLTECKIGPTFFLPSYHVGVYGSWFRLRSPAKSNNALYDFAVAGPLAGYLSSIALVLAGAWLTTLANPEAIRLFPQVPAKLFQESVIIGKLVEAVIPSYLNLPDAAKTLVFLHPAAIAGIAGIYATACAMLPFGQTDGGRLFRATWGRDSSIVFQVILTLAMIIPAIIGKIDVVLAYTVFIQFTAIKEDEFPAQNEMDAPGSGKKILHASLMLFSLLCFWSYQVPSFLESFPNA